MSQRNYTPADRLLMGLNSLLAGASRTHAPDAQRKNPAGRLKEAELSDDQRRHAAGLMRVNHAGEVAAQALYHGQASTARNPRTREHLLQAAAEEGDHLRWCEERLDELGERPSLLQPLWYAGSFAIGAVAGAAGDRWSLGFVSETENQVCAHLEGHLQELPETDRRSRRIVETMRDDEVRHGADAREAGGRELPGPIRAAMKGIAKVMTGAAYRL